MKSKFRKTLHSALLFPLLFIIISCTKQKDTHHLIEGNLVVLVNGVEGYITDTDIMKEASIVPNKNKTVDIINYPQFDAITNVETAYPSSTYDEKKLPNNMGNLKKQTKLAQVPTQPLADSVKFRLIIYKASDNSLVANEEILVGQPSGLQLNMDITYKWVAFSINKSFVPDIDASNNIPRQDLANEDFIFTSGQMSLGFGQNSLPITFKRYTTQYEVNVDTRGMFAFIEESTLLSLLKDGNNLIRTADFNVLSEQFDTGTYQSITISGLKMTAPNPLELDKKQVKLYTVDPSVAGANRLKINFSPLSLTLDDATTRVFPDASVDLNHNAFTDVAPGLSSTRGRKYTITSKLIQSSIKVAGVQWARSNLYYSEDNIHTNPYRFRPSPFFRDTVNRRNGLLNYYTDPNDLWKWKARTPQGEIEETDQCYEVYPKGYWRLPTAEDYEALKKLYNKPKEFQIFDRNDAESRSLILDIAPFKLFEYAISYPHDEPHSSTNPNPYGSDKLIFTGVGYMNSVGDVLERPRYTSLLTLSYLQLHPSEDGNILSLLGALKGAGFYWTSKHDGYETASFYKFEYTNGKLAQLDIYIAGINLLSVEDVGTYVLGGHLKKQALNIRCVRNTNYKG